MTKARVSLPREISRAPTDEVIDHVQALRESLSSAIDKLNDTISDTEHLIHLSSALTRLRRP